MTLPMRRRPLSTVLLLAAWAALMFSGCATTEGIPVVTQLSPDTYRVTLKERSSYFATDKPKFKSQAVNHSLDFAAAKGKVAVPITLRENTAGMFEDRVSVEYEFRLVDKNDPRAHRNQPEAEEAAKPDPARKADIYTDLTKLDDLRKKGIITQAEFESEKKKLLSHSQ